MFDFFRRVLENPSHTRTVPAATVRTYNIMYSVINNIILTVVSYYINDVYV